LKSLKITFGELSVLIYRALPVRKRCLPFNKNHKNTWKNHKRIFEKKSNSF